MNINRLKALAYKAGTEFRRWDWPKDFSGTVIEGEDDIQRVIYTLSDYSVIEAVEYKAIVRRSASNAKFYGREAITCVIANQWDEAIKLAELAASIERRYGRSTAWAKFAKAVNDAFTANSLGSKDDNSHDDYYDRDDYRDDNDETESLPF